MARKKGKGSAQQAETPSIVVSKAQELGAFFEESKVEIKKVTWPSRKDTIATCAAVLIVTLVLSLYLYVVDLGLNKVIELILS